MSKQANRNPAADQAADFEPIALRARHDGWTPARQIAFIRELAGCACVEEACRAVGMSPRAAYNLRGRSDAISFRQAWDAALDLAASRVEHAALSRALNGVPVPIFYKGEQVGERRVFNEGLTKFMLRYRRPEQYGAWLDDVSTRERHPDGPAIRLTEAVRRLAEDGTADQAGRPRPTRRPMKVALLADDPEEMAAAEQAAEERDEAARAAEFQRYLNTLGAVADNSAKS